ncbi:MAG TPA: response regulator [Rhodanobacteraceae bacterium]|nr:response regulator [Rhodanobacteraceae bacterium]
MPVFDLFKRLVGTNAPVGERRGNERVRASLGARVLVVDDSATIRAVLGKMLAQDSYEVLVAVDGESAVALAQAQLPDLIFLDIVLPGMSGFAVLRALRRDGRTRTTPIIMMSGNQQATEQFYVQRFGADGFVKKPFGRADVFHAIRSLVQAGRMPARLEAEPVEVIPEGMTQEEWNAIPDIGMPDEAHMAPAAATEPSPEPAPAIPAAGAQATSRTDAPVHAWSVPAASGAMRPSIGRGMQGAMGSGPAPLVVHVSEPRSAPATGPEPDAAPAQGESHR